MLRCVKTKNGTVKGLPAADPRITSFKGIPFAAPPVGENRWRAPQPVQDWEGVRNAYDFGGISMQAPTGIGDDIYSREWNVDPDLLMQEDCLYLNIWTNAKTGEENMPVLVWFFGGGLQCGHPAEMEFDGERLARRGIVVVTVNYRVNVFGFLTSEEICETQPEAPGNFGHLDQQVGILWVRENIAAFGGNPNKITIAGQSAGGGSVMAQLTSPQNEGLFQQAIVESGVFYPPYDQEVFKLVFSVEEGKAQGKRFLDFIGAENIAQARAMDAVYIRDKYLEFGELFATLIDNKFCTANVYEAYRMGRRLNIPVLAGLTKDEFIGAFPCEETEEAFERKAQALYGGRVEEFQQICRVNAEGDIKKILKNAEVRIIECTLRSMFETDDMTHYMYLFDTEIPGWDTPGSFHSVDLWFFFESLAKCWRPFQGRHYDQARILCNYWANFVKSGNPNGNDADGAPMPQWELYTKENPYYLLMTDRGIGMKKEPAEPVVRFVTDEMKSRF